MSAFGGKADINGRAPMSAFDPSRTCGPEVCCSATLSYRREIHALAYAKKGSSAAPKGEGNLIPESLNASIESQALILGNGAVQLNEE